MGKIDTSGWKEFRVGELFDIKHPAARSEKKYCEGEINYVSSGAFNNGVANKLMPLPNELLDRGGCITVSPLDGSSFYQEEDFLGRGGSGASISILYNSHLNKNNALFICSVIRSSANGFGYTDLLNGENLKSLTIKLPVDKTGQPDWAYMESYMANLEAKVAESLTMLQAAKDAEKKKVDTREWGEFQVGELFDIKHPAARSEKKYCEGEINYVSSGAFNNGVANKLMPLPNELLDRGGCITVSPLDGSSFYQEEDFLGRGGSGASISILYNSHLNKNNALFICSVIRSSANGFGYTDLLNGENLKSLTIKLPVDKTGQPDWAYMEEYMRKVEERVKKTINTFCVIRKIKYDC